MNDEKKFQNLKSHRAPFLDLLGAELQSFRSDPPLLVMQFMAKEEICHSNGTIVQGGFVTAMLDSPMAHLVIGLLDFKYNPMTLDITVNFLSAAKPGKLVCSSRVIKLGKTIGFLASELHQNEEIVATATSTVRLVPMATTHTPKSQESPS